MIGKDKISNNMMYEWLVEDIDSQRYKLKIHKLEKRLIYDLLTVRTIFHCHYFPPPHWGSFPVFHQLLTLSFDCYWSRLAPVFFSDD